MRTILFITNHPAPYMNRWFEIIERNYTVNVIYHYYKAIYKQWQNFEPYNGDYLSNTNIFKLLKKLLENDFIILCGLNKPKYILSLFILVLFRKKFAVYSDYPTNVNGRFIFIKRIVYKNLVPFFFCATASTVEFYRNKYQIAEDKIKIFPYAHNIQSSYPEEYNATRKKLIDNGAKIKIFVANSFYKRKGYSILYESLIKLKKKNLLDEFEFKIAGVGEDFEKYKKLFFELSSNIELLGWVEDEQYNELMKQTDILLHPSLIEPFGIPPLDAMENGKLLIASDGVKSVDSIILNGVNGFLYTAEDSNELLDILIYVVNNKNEIYKIGGNAYNSVLLHYPKNKIIQSLDSCFFDK